MNSYFSYGCIKLPHCVDTFVAINCSYFFLFSFFTAPPRFTKVPVDQIGVSGGVVSFVCQATGDPKPRVSWNKKGKKVNSQRIEVSQLAEIVFLFIFCLGTPSDTSQHYTIDFKKEISIFHVLSDHLFKAQSISALGQDSDSKQDMDCRQILFSFYTPRRAPF